MHKHVVGEPSSALIDDRLPEYAVLSSGTAADVLLSDGIFCGEEALRLACSLLDCTAVHGVYAWVAVHTASREGVRFSLSEDGSVNCQGDEQGHLSPRCFSMITELELGLVLDLAQIRLIQLLLVNSRRITLRRLRSTSARGLRWLQAESVDETGHREPLLILIGNPKALEAEMQSIRSIAQKSGIEAYELVHGMRFLDRQGDALTESSGDGEGAVVLRLVGACWLTPAFSSQVALGTYQRALLASLQETSDCSEYELSVLCGMWRQNGQLHALATRNASRAVVAAAEADGFISQQLDRIANALALAFVPVATDEEAEKAYETPVKLRTRLDGLVAAGRLRLDALPNHRSDFAASLVHVCTADVINEVSFLSLLTLIDTLEALLAEPPSWLASWRPLQTFQHGDLRPSNMLIDPLGSLWILDWSLAGMSNPFDDAAKVVATMLFEHYSITHDELKSAGAKRLERIFGLSESAAARLSEAAITNETKDKLVHALEQDVELAPALIRLSDEASARQTHSQANKLFESLLEPVDGKPPKLWHLANRKLPAWVTGRQAQYLHRVIVSAIEAAMELVSTCRQRCKEVADATEETPPEGQPPQVQVPPDLHTSNLYFSLLNVCLRALCEAHLSLWQKRLAWDLSQQCARALTACLQPKEDRNEPLPPAVRAEPVGSPALLMASGPLVMLHDFATRLNVGTQGKFQLAVVGESGDAMINSAISAPVSSGSSSVAARPSAVGAKGRWALVREQASELLEPGSTPDVSSAISTVTTQQQSSVDIALDVGCHAVLPWPIPHAEHMQMLVDSPTTQPPELEGEALRRCITPSFSRYAAGQEVVMLHEGAWVDAVVVQPPESLCSTVHRIDLGGAQSTVTHLHPWNHTIRRLSSLSFTSLRLRYVRALATEHASITDSISGKPLDVVSQCVPLEMVASSQETTGLQGELNLEQLYDWLRSAHASRAKIPSTLSRFQRLISQGMPDEAVGRLSKEFADLAASLSGSQSKGVACLEAANNELGTAKATFSTLWERLLTRQRADLDQYNLQEKAKEEAFKQGQTDELQQFLKVNQGELDVLSAEQRKETQVMEAEHQQQKLELTNKELVAKKQADQESEAELKAFKEGQYRTADKQKRELHANRTEAEKELTASMRIELDEYKEKCQENLVKLQQQQQKESDSFHAGGKKEGILRMALYSSMLSKLDEEQTAQRSEFEAKQKEVRDVFADAAAAKEASFKAKSEEDLRQFNSGLDDERKKVLLANKEAKKALIDSQNEERNQFLAVQKAEMKEVVEKHQKRRADLAKKQDDEKKADFARRREVKPEAKADKTKDKKQIAKEKAAEKARLAEEEAKKISPQKERDMLDAVLQEERDAKAAAQEVEAGKLMSEQAEKGQTLTTSQDEMMKEFTETQVQKRKDAQAKSDADAHHFQREMADERSKFDKKMEDEAAKLQKALVDARRKLEDKRGKEDEEKELSKEDQAKKMKAAQQLAKDTLVKDQLAGQNAMEAKQEKRLRQLIQTHEDELASFVQKQEADRKELVTKHKAAERKAAEKMEAERKMVEDRLSEAMSALTAQHEVVQEALRVRHDTKRQAFEGVHFAQRKDLATELQKARTTFSGQQSIARDQHANDFRSRLAEIVESAQNDFSLALLGKGCVLLTGGPAAGKTTTIRQLLAHALQDQESQLVPILIRVQELQRNLLLDREQFAIVQRRLEAERVALDARHQAERDRLTARDSAEASITSELIDERQVGETKQLEADHNMQLQKAYGECAFASSWNWVDAHLRRIHGPTSPIYAMLRQALLSRRTLLLLDGIDEGGAAGDGVIRHITEVLAPQGHTMVVTSRPDGLDTDRFQEYFEHLALQPLSDALQEELVELRLGDDPSSSQKLLSYMKSQVPLDTEGLRETCNPLMISLMISVFENLADTPVPDSKTALYSVASRIMLERSLGGGSHGVAAPAAATPHLMPLLEAIFFRAHATQKRMIEVQHVEAAALELGAPGQLAAMEWPPYKGRVRVGQVVKLLRGDNAGRVGVLTSDSRGKLINGRTPRSPFRVTFPDKMLSPWLREREIVSSGLELASFEAKVGDEGQRKSIRAAFEKLPNMLHLAVRAVRTWVLQDQLPLLSLLQSEPLQMQASHLSFQEFYCARALCKGMALPGEPPWRWSAWWGNTLRLGAELGDSFGSGLMRAVSSNGLMRGAGDSLDLSGQIAGHRPTSLAAIAQLMLGLTSIDLSQNEITPDEVRVLAEALQKSTTLVELNLAKNALGDEGAAILSSHLPDSKLLSLNLFGTGIKEDGAYSLTTALSSSTTLTHLNLQYNAVRGESKKALEAANAARTPPLFLVL